MNQEYNDLVWEMWESALPSANGWRRANCPVCIYEGQLSDDHRQSLGIHEKGVWHCFRCESKGFLDQLGDDYLPDIVPEGVREEETEKPCDEIPLPENFLPIWEEPGLSSLLALEAREYLLKRGFSQEHWKKAGIGFCPTGYFQDRVIVPVFNLEKTKTVGFAARLCRQHMPGERKTLFPQGMKTGEVLYEQHLLYERTDKPLLIMEGVFDVLPYFGQACCCFGKIGSKQYRLLLEAKRPLVIVFDADTNTLSWSVAQKLRLDGKVAGHVRLPNGKDPDEVDPNWLLEKANESIKQEN